MTARVRSSLNRVRRARALSQARSRSRVVLAEVFVLADLAALGIAEALILLGAPVMSMAVHLLVLVSTPVQAVVAPPRARRLLIALGLIPIVRTVGWVVSTLRLPVPFALLLQDGIFVLVFIVAFHTLRLSLKNVGLTRQGLSMQFALALLGVPLGILAWRATDLSPLVAGGEKTPALLAAGLIGSGLLEELLFRGVLQRSAFFAFGSVGLFVGSLAYATLYAPFGSLSYFVLALVTSVLLSWIVLRTGSVVGAGLCHAVTNVLAFLVLPLWLAPLLASSPAESMLRTSDEIAPPRPSVLADSTQTRSLGSFIPQSPPQDMAQDSQDAAMDAEDDEVERIFLVSQGDTLENIAERFDTTVEALLEANDMDQANPTLSLSPGQVLVLPPVESESDPP